jgi:hypothetical protein
MRPWFDANAAISRHRRSCGVAQDSYFFCSIAATYPPFTRQINAEPQERIVKERVVADEFLKSRGYSHAAPPSAS